MLRGNFAAAWHISDAVLRRRLQHAVDCNAWSRHEQFVWRGQPVDGERVLVRCYHGLGDTLQFVRLLAPLRQRTREIVLWAQPVLLPLLQSVAGIDRLLPLHDGAVDVDYDLDVELMEIAHLLRLTPERIPNRVPYIHLASPPPPCGGGTGRGHTPLHVGLVWRSGNWAPERSIPRRFIAGLAAAHDVRWYSLQYPSERLPLDAIDWSCADIVQMAARIRSLDLLICVDTMAAHLAGAIAAPVWTLLHADCDWRWMRERSDTPWYPTMRLFRQRSAGNWRGVMDEVLAALAMLLNRGDGNSRGLIGRLRPSPFPVPEGKGKAAAATTRARGTR